MMQTANLGPEWELQHYIREAAEKIQTLSSARNTHIPLFTNKVQREKIRLLVEDIWWSIKL